MFPAQVQRDSDRCFVGSKCSVPKSQMSVPALAFAPSPWWGADGPMAPGNPLSSFTLLKALLCYLRLSIVLILRVAMNSGLILKALLFVYTYMYNSLGLNLHTDFVFVQFVAFQQYGLPSFTSLLSDVISFSTGIRCLNGRGMTSLYICICMQILLCFMLQNLTDLTPN